MKASDRTASGSKGFMTLKVELPPTGIVRTISVPECMTLEDLHEDAFAAFGRRLRMDATKTALRKVFPKRGAKLTYEYDFAGQWHFAESLKAPCPCGSGKKYKLCGGRGKA